MTQKLVKFNTVPSFFSYFDVSTGKKEKKCEIHISYEVCLFISYFQAPFDTINKITFEKGQERYFSNFSLVKSISKTIYCISKLTTDGNDL